MIINCIIYVKFQNEFKMVVKYDRNVYILIQDALQSDNYIQEVGKRKWHTSLTCNHLMLLEYRSHHCPATRLFSIK